MIPKQPISLDIAPQKESLGDPGPSTAENKIFCAVFVQ